MSFVGKFEYNRQENFDGYLKAIGLPEEKIQALLASPKKPMTEISVNGDSYTVKRTGGLKDYDVTFNLGKEYSEDLLGHPVKAVTVKDGSNLKTTATSDRGQTEVITQVNGDELIYTLKDLKTGTVAKRIYKRV